MKIGDLFLALGIDGSADFKTAVAKAAGEAGTAGAQTLGEKLKANLTKAMVGIGAAVGAGLASSVQEFVKFDDQMRTVYTLLPDISEKAMGEMEDQVKGLAVEMGRLPEDIIPGLYDALSSGIPQDNVFAFMEAATKAAVAGGADTQQTVKVLSATINAFGLDVQDTGQLTDSFFNAINRGVTTFPELAASMSHVTPIAAAMGLSIEDVLAAITAMTLQGTPTAQAVTGITASLVALQRTTPEMEAALKSLGYATGQAALDALGYQGTMEALAGEADRMGVPLIKLTGQIEGSAAMLQLTGQNADKANELLGTFGDTAGQTTAAFERMEGGVGGSARRLAAQIKVTMIDIGEQFQALGPLFTAFGPTMGRLLGAGLGAAGGLVARGLIALATSGPIKAAAGVLGGAIGAIVGEAQAIAATGVTAAKGFAARLAAMAIPLTPAGTTLGGVIGGAIALGIVTLGGVAITAAVIQAMNDAKKAVETDPQGINNAELFGARAPMWARARVNAAQEMQSIGAGALAAFTAEWDRGIAAGLSPEAALEPARQAGLAIGTAQSDAWKESIETGVGEPDFWQRVGTETGTAAADATVTGWTDAQAGARMAAAFAADWNARVLDEFRALGAGVPGEIGKGIQDSMGGLDAGLATLRDILKNGLTPDDLATEAAGKRTVQSVMRGLQSEIPGARETAQQVAVAAMNALEDAGRTGVRGSKDFEAMGRYYDALLASGMTSAQARVTLASGGVADATISRLEAGTEGARQAGADTTAAYAGGLLARIGAHISSFGTLNAALLPGTATGAAASVRQGAAGVLGNTSGFSGYGSATIEEYTRGISNGRGAAVAAANAIAAAVRNALRATSPPDNPLLHDIGKWGQATIEEYAGGLSAGKGAVERALGSIAKGIGGFGNPFGNLTAGLSPTFALPSSGFGSMSDSRTYNAGPVTVNAYGQTQDDIELQIENARRRQELEWRLQGA